MKELLELKEKTELEITFMYHALQAKHDVKLNRDYLDKMDFLKLINIIYDLNGKK